jgi:hypothetical protein
VRRIGRAPGARRNRSRAEDFHFCVHSSACGLRLDRFQSAKTLRCRPSWTQSR